MRSLVFTAALLVSCAAHAQGWPAKSIRWIVPYPPGGSTDIATRVVAERVGQVLGQPAVVENRAGAGGNIGIDAAAKSAPDGYTLLVAPDAIASNPHLYKISWDPFRDFAPVIQLARQPVMLAVHPSLGVGSVAELIELAKKTPGLGFATSGAGSQQHMAAEWFAQISGIQLTHVPYRGGGQAITDLVGGQVKIGSLGSSPLIPHYKAGKLRLLAQSTATRAPSLPEVPTYEEAGVKGLVIEQWLGIFGPAGTGPDIVARLNAEVAKALAEPAVRERYAQSALEPVGGRPEPFAKLLREDYDKYARLIRELKIKLE
jgi:tripartite-type tricarboxylate transporter receptor subunit TctC